MSDLLLIARPDGRIVYANELAVSRFGESVGSNLSDILDAATAGCILSPENRSGWSGGVSAGTLEGRPFGGLLSSIPIVENDAVMSIIVVIRDVEREYAERDALLQSQKMITLGELVAGTSHALNNPLAIVMGYSDLLLEDLRLSQDQRDKVESVRKNALRASNIVHALMTFARKRRPERLKTQVNPAVNAALRLKDYDLHTSGIEIETEFGENLPSVYADPNQIQQVLLNVVNNAQDAVLSYPEGRKISIRTEASGENVIIRVRDTGPGISSDNLSKVFEPFFTTKSSENGRGLGLAIAHGIVREHGGRIRIDSQIGRGTEVAIELPVSRGEGIASAIRLSEENPRLGLKLLVVDDEPDIVAILGTALSKAGFIVDHANNAAQALGLVTNQVYDFVLTDVKMPGGNGFDLYRALCEIDPRYRFRVAFLTADINNPGTQQILNGESLPYFSKPFDFQAIAKFLVEKAGAVSIRSIRG